MAPRFLFALLLILTIVAVNVWHYAAYYIVHEGGIVVGLLTLIGILLLGFVLEPYLD
jgi:hypothetical protein